MAIEELEVALHPAAAGVLTEVPKDKLLKPGELERAVNLAARRTSATDGIVDDGPSELAPAMATRAAESRPDRRIWVVIANQHLEIR